MQRKRQKMSNEERERERGRESLDDKRKKNLGFLSKHHRDPYSNAQIYVS